MATSFRRFPVRLVAGLSMMVALQQAVAPGVEISHLDLRLSLARSGERVDVAARYRLRLPSDATSIPLRGVAFLGARPDELRASLDGRPVEVELGPAELAGVRDTMGLVGMVRLPPVVERADSSTLELRYRVAGAVRRSGDEVDVVVPILLVSGHQSGSREDLFRLQLQLPSDLYVYEFFPTVRRSITRTGGTSSHTLTLQAIPAMIRWRGRLGQAPVMPFQRMVDVFTIAVLLLLGVVASRVIRGA